MRYFGLAVEVDVDDDVSSDLIISGICDLLEDSFFVDIKARGVELTKEWYDGSVVNQEILDPGCYERFLAEWLKRAKLRLKNEDVCSHDN